ncbi:Trp biosynthesis-associated membrane protein, partial [Arthrobacter sp. Hiyo1]
MAILALAVFGTTTQTWINVRLDPAAAANADLHVQGSKAATAVTALALVALAGGLASSIAGKVSRWIIATIIVLASAGILIAAVTVLADPLGAAQGTIAATTGISGGQAAASS